MNKQNVIKQIEALGWTIAENNLDFRLQDSTLWWGYDGYVHHPVVLRVVKGNDVIELIAVGDIHIVTEHASFRYKGRYRSGELTYYLRQKGEWLNNNWFEININESSYKGFAEVFYYLDSAMVTLLENMKDFDKDV